MLFNLALVALLLSIASELRVSHPFKDQMECILLYVPEINHT
jgi:hypothetical protein